MARIAVLALGVAITVSGSVCRARAQPAEPPPDDDAAEAPEAAAEPPAGTVLSLADATARALAGPRNQMARSDTDAARARLDEAGAQRLPRGTLTGFFTASPEINCDDVDCTRTSPEDFSLDFAGVFGGAKLDLVQPLYTFGKIGAARSAARDGVTAQSALEDAAAGDVAVDVARAYWGVKLARELGWMLDDGIERIEAATKTLDDELAQGKSGVTVQDRQRIQTLLAEAKIQRAEARQGEVIALTALRVLTDVADADVDDAELASVDAPLPDPATAAARAEAGRPEVRAATAGASAYAHLAELEAAYYLPDLALVGSVEVNRAQGADNPPSAYANDPFNRTTAGLALVLRWQLDPWTTRAKTARARAQARRARQQADLARDGAELDARTAQGEAATAKDRVAAAIDGEKAARAWVAAVLQNQAVGTVEAKELADAYIAWFQMSARKLSAIFQWNVAVVRLQRATGEFRAAAPRRKEQP
jgi:outer membrane protein TolC